MPIAVSCHCGKSYSAPDAMAGKRVRCSACGSAFLVPDPMAASPVPPPPIPAAQPSASSVSPSPWVPASPPSPTASAFVPFPVVSPDVPIRPKGARSTLLPWYYYFLYVCCAVVITFGCVCCIAVFSIKATNAAERISIAIARTTGVAVFLATLFLTAIALVFLDVGRQLRGIRVEGRAAP